MKINFSFSNSNTTVKGFFVNENVIYSINVNEGVILTVDGARINVKRDDFYITENDLFMKSDLYERVFGITFKTSLKSLSAGMVAKEKLPYVIEIEREQIRDKLAREQRQYKADLYIPRQRKLLGLGFSDWQLSYNHSSPNYNSYSYNLSAGTEFLGGDLSASTTGNNELLFDKNNVFWRWRYVIESKLLSQVIAGDITTPSGLFTSGQGIQLTNSPPTFRRKVGTYKIFDQTNPNWDVELYINNTLYGFARANENGYFEFNIPLPYGSVLITLKFFGPSGEIRTSEKMIQIPYTFIPQGTFEYNISGGRQKYGDRTAFSEGDFYWGATSFITIGSGLTYIDLKEGRKYYPGLNASARIFNSIILSSLYYADIKGSASLNLLLPSMISSQLTFTKYAHNSFTNPGGLLEEKSFDLFLPLTIKSVSTNFRINTRDALSNFGRIYSLNTGMYISYDRFQGIVSTQGSWVRDGDIYSRQNLSSSFSVSYRFLRDLLLRTEVQADHNENKITSVSLTADKSVFDNGWISLRISKDVQNNSLSYGLNFRLDFDALRLNSDYLNNEGSWQFQQTVYGSLAYDNHKNKFLTTNHYLVSKSGLSLIPYIDANGNGILDDNEKIVNTDFRVNCESGTLVKSGDKKSQWFIDMESYETYFMQIDPVSFDNSNYRPKYKSFSIVADPNRFKPIYIPLSLSGSVSGRITTKTDSDEKGVNRIKVILESLDGKTRIEVRTFSDGEYLFDNVFPGKYKIHPDPNELLKRSLKSPEPFQIIELKASDEGDSLDGVNFVLTKEAK